MGVVTELGAGGRVGFGIVVLCTSQKAALQQCFRVGA